MHQLVSEYISRFTPPFKAKFSPFFTQYNLEEYKQLLPYLVDIEYFCERVTAAVTSNERICIYSDYDTDAITATATMYWGLIELGVKPENLSYYAPDRFTEGYGMNTEAALELSQKYDLVISVDCGINSTKEAELFKKSKCDLIITDHHQLNGEIPDCVAVINPRLSEVFAQDPSKLKTRKISNKAWQKSIQRPLKNLNTHPEQFVSSSVTGVGVAWFSLVWLSYYLEEQGIIQTEEPRKNLNKLLPFVAIGTIADCQSVLDPINRLLVRAGLNILQSNSHGSVGLQALSQLTGFTAKTSQGYTFTSQDLGYIFSPILNSSGRISHANLSISVLTSHTLDKALPLAQQLIDTNEERKQMVRDILKSIEQEASEQILAGNSVIWLEGKWNKGIIGLLASRLVNEHAIPVIISAEEEGVIVGSSRAPEGYNLPKAFQEAGELFEKAGGHPGAAGFAHNPKNAEKIKKIVINALENQKSLYLNNVDSSEQNESSTYSEPVQKVRSKKHILHTDLATISRDLLQQIMNLDPFGLDFPFPHFLIEIPANTPFRWLGQEQKHIKYSIGTEAIPLTGFHLDQEIKENLMLPQETRKSVFVLAKISQNTWNNNTNLELIIDRFLV
jgi:single-stranded-DNA-specific exonuclease